jgi:hypothetical protein
MSYKQTCLLFSLVGLILGAIGAPCTAQAAGREEVYIRKGVELRRKGQDKEALVHFQKAYEVTHTARAAAQLGLCEQALKQWLPAYNHLSDALASQSDVWISEHRGTLESAIGEVQKQLGRVEVKGSPQNGVVVVAGEMVGQLSEGISVPVLPGSVTVTVTADGYVRAEETRQVMAGQLVVVNVTLKASVPVAPKVAKEAVVTPPPASNDSGVTANATAAVDSNSSPPSKLVAYSVIGAGGVLVATGAVFALRSSSLAKEARDADTYDPSKEDSAKSAGTIGMVCLGAGAVGLAVGTFLYLRTGETSEVAIAPHGSGTGASVSWKGSF